MVDTKKIEKTIFISADHGLAVVYFLQSNVVKTLLEKGCKIVILTDEGLLEQIREKFEQPGLFFESLRLNAARKFSESVSSSVQYWLHHLRRYGASNRINTEALDSQIPQVEFEARGKRRILAGLMRPILWLMRHFRFARTWIRNAQYRFSSAIYKDLFEKYKPDLVVASTPGWRYDRFLLREAAESKIPTASVIVGWDNPSSYSLPGAPMDWVVCWSEIQKEELVLGSDWNPNQVFIGGIPSYDGYFQKKWVMDRSDYFKLHDLDPDRKLIAYASSFITYAPNFNNIKALAELVENEKLDKPSQLLIRLHPNHFLGDPLYAGERKQVMDLVKNSKHVRLVEPVPLGGKLGHYSGEDMPEKTSMMAYADVFTTVYSTMVVEAAIHERSIVSVCIDNPGGWNQSYKYSLSLKEIGEWPTHDRFRKAEAGQVAYDQEQLKSALNNALSENSREAEQRERFVKDEITFTDGKAGERVGEFLYRCAGRHYRKDAG